MKVNEYISSTEEGIYVVHTIFSGWCRLGDMSDITVDVFTVGSSGGITGYSWRGRQEHVCIDDIYNYIQQMIEAVKKEIIFIGDGIRRDISHSDIPNILHKQSDKLKEFYPNLRGYSIL